MPVENPDGTRIVPGEAPATLSAATRGRINRRGKRPFRGMGVRPQSGSRAYRHIVACVADDTTVLLMTARYPPICAGTAARCPGRGNAQINRFCLKPDVVVLGGC
jgi:hypothetical protein